VILINDGVAVSCVLSKGDFLVYSLPLWSILFLATNHGALNTNSVAITTREGVRWIPFFAHAKTVSFASIVFTAMSGGLVLDGENNRVSSNSESTAGHPFMFSRRHGLSYFREDLSFINKLGTNALVVTGAQGSYC
jgi:hypothetical protein